MVIPDIYSNAGGVTVSYFEWLKNLARAVRPDVEASRASRRAHDVRRSRSRPASLSLTTSARDSPRGPDEADLVNSGLEETMSALTTICWKPGAASGMPDLRIAAFVNAIDKVARSYMELGIFP